MQEIRGIPYEVRCFDRLVCLDRHLEQTVTVGARVGVFLLVRGAAELHRGLHVVAGAPLAVVAAGLRGAAAAGVLPVAAAADGPPQQAAARRRPAGGARARVARAR